MITNMEHPAFNNEAAEYINVSSKKLHNTNNADKKAENKYIYIIESS